ncbi:Divalent-cation tolerance protein CutA [Erythrobacter sp. EC-HK427]|nr:Divalent-cation tolerance protein CutA [Erythrobacter sp. EC-HK427]
MSDGAALIWSPFGDRQSAEAVAEVLLAEKLIACANILPGVTALFQWHGKVDRAEEVGVLFKTTQNLLDKATVRIAELHPYDTPAVIGWHCEAAPPATLGWLEQSLAPPE